MLRVFFCGWEGCRRVLVREMELTGSAFLEALSSGSGLCCCIDCFLGCCTLGSGRDDERDLWLRFVERRSGEVLSQFGRSWVRKWTQVLDYCKMYC